MTSLKQSLFLFWVALESCTFHLRWKDTLTVTLPKKNPLISLNDKMELLGKWAMKLTEECCQNLVFRDGMWEATNIHPVVVLLLMYVASFCCAPEEKLLVVWRAKAAFLSHKGCMRYVDLEEGLISFKKCCMWQVASRALFCLPHVYICIFAKSSSLFHGNMLT